MPQQAEQGRDDGPVDAGLRTPHPTLLVCWSLAFVAFISAVATANGFVLSEATRGDVAATAVLAAITGSGAAALYLVPRLRINAVAIVSLALLDVAPLILQYSVVDPADARARITLLILPTMIAAASLPRHVAGGQLAVAVGLAAMVLATAPDDRSAMRRIVEIIAVCGTLAVGSAMVRSVKAAISRRTDDLRRLALTDKLTDVLNRRGLADAFPALCLSAGRRESIGVLSLDIDHFKWFNDTYGHAAGDDVLRLVCRTLKDTTGDGSLVARTGGEELVALIRGPAEPAAERFRAALATTRQPRVTVSIGILDVPVADSGGADCLWRILDAADHAMYEAKATGRDRVCRGQFDPDRAVRVPLAPVPRHAAVPQPADDTTSTTGSLPGWVLALFGLVGILSGAIRHSGPTDTLVGQLYMTIMAVALIVGVMVVGMGPLLDRFRWAAGVVGADLVILVIAADLSDGAARMVAIIPALLPGLMVAQHFGRGPLVTQHIATLAICMTAPLYDGDAKTVALAGFTAAVLIGSTELIYFLQLRNRAAAADLHRWSVTDPLTSLANRHGLELGFENLSRAQQLTVLALDVDDFKGINDTYGHAAGDDALVRLAQMLEAVAGDDAVVCRTGGDEFVVLAPSMRPSSLTNMVTRAAALLPLPLSVSIGSAVAAPHRLRSLWQLVDAADAALIRAKRSRKQQRRVTRPDDLEEIVGAGEAGDADEISGADEVAGTEGSPAVMTPAVPASPSLSSPG